MRNSRIQEVAIGVALVALLVLSLNPFGLWMPDMAHIAVLAGIIACFGLFAAFILREKAADERDVAHRSFAARSAFLAGSAILIVAILIQGARGDVDGWLVATLVAMIVAKLSARAYMDLTS